MTYASAPPESIDWTPLALQNSWTGTLTAKLAQGIVYVYGSLTPGTVANGTVISNMPAIGRPAAPVSIPVIPFGNGTYVSALAVPRIMLSINGDFTIHGLTSTTQPLSYLVAYPIG